MRRLLRVCIQWMASLGLLYAIWMWVLAPTESRAILVGPLPVFAQAEAWVRTGVLGSLVVVTLVDALIGLAAGMVLGLTLTVVTVVTHGEIAKVIERSVAALYALPKFALIPIVVVWLGNGLLPRAGFVALAVFPLIFVNTVSGFRSVDIGTIQMMSLLGASRRQVAVKLFLPHAGAYVAAALTLATSLALMTAVGAEMLFGATVGLGGELQTASAFFNAGGVLAALMVATGLSVLLLAASELAGRRLTWRR